MSWEVELAKEFKKRNNKPLIGACIGVVSSVSPFNAQIVDGLITLDQSNTYICNSLLERKSDYKVGEEMQPQPITLFGVMKPGDKVLVIPAASEQSFFIVDIIKGV